MPHAAQSVHDVKHDLRGNRLDRGQRADEAVGIGLLPAVRAVHVREMAVGDILQEARDTRGAVLLHVGYVDNLRQRLGDQAHQKRTRVFLAEKLAST